MNDLDRIAWVSAQCTWEQLVEYTKSMPSEHGFRIYMPEYIIRWNKEHRDALTTALFESIKKQGLEIVIYEEGLYLRAAKTSV